MQVAPESAQPLGQGRVGCEVQVGEQDVVWLETPDLGRLGFLDLDDQRRLVEQRVGVGHDRRALLGVSLIGDRGAEAGAALNEHLVTSVDQLADAGRRQRNPILVGLDLGWDPNLHL